MGGCHLSKFKAKRTSTPFIAVCILLLLLLSACSAPQVKYYADGSHLARLTVDSNQVQTYMSTQPTILNLNGDRKQSANVLLVRPRPEDEANTDGAGDDESGFAMSSSAAQGKMKTDIWVLLDATPMDAEMANAGTRSIEAPPRIPLGKAWDEAYKQSENYSKNFDAEITGFEPNIYKTSEGEAEPKGESQSRGEFVPSGENSQDKSEIAAYPSEVWGYAKAQDGSPIPNWHFSDEFSQLDSAKGVVADKSKEAGERILIAHLDTGYNGNDANLLVNRSHQTEWPYGEFMSSQSKNFFKNECKKFPAAKLELGECPGHGTATLSVLAGGEYRFEIDKHQYSGTLGADPYANIVEYRIKDSVVHLRPSEMANAIQYAVNKKVDVISLSAGGLPSGAQRDAVNLAYDNGVAIFAATGDFFKSPIPIFGFDKTPSIVGYPARYTRVMAVAGTTYDHTSYGDDPYSVWTAIFKNAFNKSMWLSWMLRGNYGPSSVMYPGKAVSAYAPNIMRSEPPTVESTQKLDNAISLDGAGTSHSTPQVAGAAALWLQAERKRIDYTRKWRSWEKVEAVYRAVATCSADRTTRPKEMGDEDFTTRFGAGHLRARTALNFHFPDNPTTLGHKRPEARIGYTWLSDLILSMRAEATTSPNLLKLHASMMTLEGLQFAFLDRGLANLKETLDKCLIDAARNKKSGKCEDEIATFLNGLAAYPEISTKLRDILNGILASKGWAGKITIATDLKALKRALTDTDPNRCDLVSDARM